MFYITNMIYPDAWPQQNNYTLSRMLDIRRFAVHKNCKIVSWILIKCYRLHISFYYSFEYQKDVSYRVCIQNKLLLVEQGQIGYFY